MAKVGGTGEAGGFGREGSAGAAGGFFAVVDDLNVALGVGVDVAGDLVREVEDHVGIAGGVAGDGERGLGVLDVAADVALDRRGSGGCRGGAVDRDSDHDSVGEQAGRNGAVGEGVLGKL